MALIEDFCSYCKKATRDRDGIFLWCNYFKNKDDSEMCLNYEIDEEARIERKNW